MKTTVLLLATGATLAVSATAMAADATHGAQLYSLWCGYCHDPVSERQPQLAGTYTLQQRYQGQRPAALVDRNDLTADYVKAVVRQGRNVMPSFRKTEVSDTELDDIAAFLEKSQ